VSKSASAASNGHVHTVEVELDRLRHFRMDFNAMTEAEAATGLNLLQPDIWGKMTATQLRALMFAALKWEDPALTLEAVGEMLTLSNASDALEKLTAAAVPPKAPSRKTRGSSGGRSAASTSA
jgi:hypothetical protein